MSSGFLIRDLFAMDFNSVEREIISKTRSLTSVERSKLAIALLQVDSRVEPNNHNNNLNHHNNTTTDGTEVEAMENVLVIDYDSEEDQRQQETRGCPTSIATITTNNDNPLPDLRQVIDRRMRSRNQALERLPRTQSDEGVLLVSS